MVIYAQGLFILFTLPLVEHSLYLYNTEDNLSVEFFDCILHEGSSYCRRPSQPMNLTRNHTEWHCDNNGTPHSFLSLKNKDANVTVIIHEWRSSVEKVEEYMRYKKVKQQNVPDGGNEHYLCECTHPQSFGKHCEYLLPMGTTLNDTLDWQLEMRRRDPWQMQIHGDIVCYRTLICNSGLLCLDWRDICDGLQQCMFGHDEDNCDLLEFNECEDDEYRCANGMCIPDEFFLDGEYDCSDLSDEKQLFNDTACTFEQATHTCDDRICLRHQWSCGDGQCISDRLHFQRESSSTRKSCNSRRDQFHWCETDASNSSRQSTLSNGKCGFLGMEQSVLGSNYNDSEQCMSLIRHLLTQELSDNISCSKGSHSLYHNISTNSCSCNIAQYPQRQILAPYASTWYNVKKNWTQRVPDHIMLNGTIKCRGYMINAATWIPYQPGLRLSSLENSLCMPKPIGTVLPRDGYDQYCYNGSQTFNNRSYNFYDVCVNSKECNSGYRIRDGSKDCHDEFDEEPTSVVSNTCANVQRHRFRCSAQQPACLLVSALNNLFDHCQPSANDFLVEIYDQLSRASCTPQSNEECAFIREYLRTSTKNDTSKSSYAGGIGTIPFRSYCDTFWNKNRNEDEDIEMCRSWWKCPETQWRCRTGQCIELSWVLDGEWDCGDASDEEALFIDNNTLSMHNLKLLNLSFLESTHNNLYMRLVSRKWCDLNIEFPCIRINTLNPSNIMLDKPCISLKQIGDGIIDCLWAWDEHARLEHCSLPSVLGYNFRCPSIENCTQFPSECVRRCNSSTTICYEPEESSSCQNRTNYMCANGICIHPWLRCNGNFDCAYGEDEYLCDTRGLTRSSENTGIYRENPKERQIKSRKQELHLPQFPFDVQKILAPGTLSPLPQSTPTENSPPTTQSSNIAYYCNRGVGVLSYNESIACFCPAQYYGNKCQYHSDRLTVVFRVNLTKSAYSVSKNYEMVLKFLVIFLYDDQPIMMESFHIRPTAKTTTHQKNIHQLLYSRADAWLQDKRNRNKNRSGIITKHPYSVRIEAYELQLNTKPQFVGLWWYTIYFDFLPSFRFAKILRWPEIKPITDPCQSGPCAPPQKCHSILNEQSSYICLCPDNYTGNNCSVRDDECHHGFCGKNALCKPNYQGYLLGHGKPYCICPLGRSGSRCDVIHDTCQYRPCRNQGICFAGPGVHDFFCLCDNQHHGKACELEKLSVKISIAKTPAHRAAIVQYFHINFKTLDLILADQRLYNKLPHVLDYMHKQTTAPEIVVAKLYSDDPMRMYLISLQVAAIRINVSTIMSEANHCPDVRTLVNSTQSML